MPIADKSEWPKTPDGTTDWEALFENEGTGIIPIVLAAETPQQLKQLSEDIIRAIFNRKRDHTIVDKVHAYLNKLIPKNAPQERLPAMKAGVKQMMLKVKHARIKKAESFVRKKKRHAKRKPHKELNRRSHPIWDLFQKSTLAKAALVLALGILLPYGIFIGSPEHKGPEGDVKKHISWIVDYVYSHMPQPTWQLVSVKKSKEAQIAIVIEITDPEHVKAINGMKRMARVALLNEVCPKAGSGVKKILDQGWTLWVALKNKDEVLTGGTCHY